MPPSVCSGLCEHFHSLKTLEVLEPCPPFHQDTLLPECLAKHLLKDLYHCHQRSIQPRRLAVHGNAKEVAVVLQGGDQLGDDLDVCVAVWIIKAIFFAFS